MDILKTEIFTFPYTDLRFSGMNTGEHILFVTRESPLIHKLRVGALLIVTFIGLVLGLMIISLTQTVLPSVDILKLPFIAGVGMISLLGIWWIGETFKKSVFIITTRRLTKIIHTTPFTWYQFSLGLDEIEDTGSYSSSYIEALFGLGYFVARSGAGAIKNFKIVNVTFAQDLHNYANKLLYAFKHYPDKVSQFRPFIPNLKGEVREELIGKYPEYRTEFD